MLESSRMGKLTALILIVFTAVWLGPMCAQLPSEPAPVAVAVPLTPLIEAPVAVPAAVVATPPAAKPAASEEPALVVSNYRSRKMFTVADGHAKISVLVTNKSDREAKDVRLSLSANAAGLPAEKSSLNWPFTIAASTAVYRGLTVSVAAVDALLGAASGGTSEMRWDLTYRLEGDETKHCYTLRSLPRQREPEGVEWKALGTSTDCPASR